MRNTGRDFWSFFAFVAVMMLAVALVISLILGPSGLNVSGAEGVARWIRDIAIAIALIIPLIMSFRYAISRWREGRRAGVVWFVLWIVAIILIVVFYFWPIIRG